MTKPQAPQFPLPQRPNTLSDLSLPSISCISAWYLIQQLTKRSTEFNARWFATFSCENTDEWTVDRSTFAAATMELRQDSQGEIPGTHFITSVKFFCGFLAE